MHTVFTRILLAFLIAWLPVSFAHAAVPGCHAAMGTHAGACAQQSQHGQMHQSGAQHAPSGCHGCALCYSCTAAAPAVATFDFPSTELRAVFVAAPLVSFFPEQPERPPKV